jgi:hypothetical protein
MPGNRRSAWAAATVCLVAMGVGACGSPTSDVRPSATQTQSSDVWPSEEASHSPVTADVRACAGVQAIISHIAVDAARWSPALAPFDKTVSTRLASEARDLAAQGPHADDPAIQRSVRDTAAAFGGVASAMKSRKRRSVDQAIARTRTTYQDLKQVCSLGDRG